MTANEQLARAQGWEQSKGIAAMWHRKGEVFPCRHYPPDYRNDPALTLELMGKYRIRVAPCYDGTWYAATEDVQCFTNTIKEAVFNCSCANENIEVTIDE